MKDMFKTVAEEAAALIALGLFVTMIAVVGMGASEHYWNKRMPEYYSARR